MLVEREAPLQMLHDVLRLARAGNGRTVIVSGEAGIGKTSLLRKFIAEVEGATVLWGSSDALFTPQPLGPLRDMAAALDPRVATLLDEMAPQDRIFPALLNALQNGRETRLLVFEDVHWADKATLDLIKYLGRRIAFLRAVLVLSMRREEVVAGHPLAEVLGDLPASSPTRIALEPLNLKSVAELAQASGQDASELHRITGGNPFYITELLDNTDAKTIPTSVRDAVWARLQRLPAEERELLEAISIAPSGAEVWFARALVEGDVEAVMASCVARGLLVEDNEERFRFRHELARVATLERVNPSTQKALHRRAYAVLAKRPSFPVACMLHHAAGAGDADNVLTLAPVAAAEAAKLGAHREAARHLATALTYVGSASPGTMAQLHEDWAYEASLVLKMDDSIIAAAHKAIALWRELGRKDKVARNLRRLSRFHWLRGEGSLAVRYCDEAIAALDGEPPSHELAMAYGVRSQLFMFNDRFDEAIEWSRKAIALAEELGDAETRIQALVNLGHSLLYKGEPEGKAHIEESLALAVKHGFHEQATRAYINYAEYAVLAREFDLAERILAEGIAYDTKHDLDFGLHYLIGRQAQLRMDQGRFAEAEAISATVLKLDRATLVMKLPALTVLAKTRVRLGKADGPELMRQAMKDALATEEQQNIVPARFGMIEMAWLAGDLDKACAELAAMAAMRIDGFASWDAGEFAVWWRRCGMAAAFPGLGLRLARPCAAELDGDAEGAARQWTQLGLPYEAGLALMASGTGLARAASLFEELGAAPASVLAGEKARAAGIFVKKEKIPRGHYGTARHHPLGITDRETDVLKLLGQGLGNHEIANRLGRSRRTVEHHVSSLLAKLNAQSRMDAMLRLRNEPWLIAGNQSPV